MGRFGKIAHNGHMWPLMSLFGFLLTPITSHPCSVPFSGPREKTSVKHGKMLTGLIPHLISRHIGMIYRNFRIRQKFKPKKLSRGQENSPHHLFELEIGL